MFKLKRLLFFFLSVILPLIFLALPCISLAADEGETLTITTYYPSPYGSYNQLYVADKLGIGTTSPQATLDVSGTDAIKIPVGTTAQRPASPANGMMRLNTTTGRL